MILLDLKPLTAMLLSAAVDLDRQALGGLWTLEGYRRELENSCTQLLALTGAATAVTSASASETGTAIASTQPEMLLGLGGFWAILEEAHIIVLAVHPQYQGRGLGQALLQGLLQVAHQRGLERATLEVRISNRPALALYQKFGFEIAGQRRRYYQDTGEDGLILWRSGLQTLEFSQQLTLWRQQTQTRLAQSAWGLRSFLDAG